MRTTAVEGLNEEGDARKKIWYDNTAYDMCFDGTNQMYCNCNADTFHERQRYSSKRIVKNSELYSLSNQCTELCVSDVHASYVCGSTKHSRKINFYVKDNA